MAGRWPLAYGVLTPSSYEFNFQSGSRGRVPIAGGSPSVFAVTALNQREGAWRAMNKTGHATDDEPFDGMFTQGMVCHETYQGADGRWLSPDEIKPVEGGGYRTLSGGLDHLRCCRHAHTWRGTSPWHERHPRCFQAHPGKRAGGGSSQRPRRFRPRMSGISAIRLRYL